MDERDDQHLHREDASRLELGEDDHDEGNEESAHLLHDLVHGFPCVAGFALSGAIGIPPCATYVCMSNFASSSDSPMRGRFSPFSFVTMRLMFIGATMRSRVAMFVRNCAISW